jgi:ABC-type polysaccharide/polyol phosphate export permease|tara:strand:- start:209 stop:565 length:357 start_codon:yes stop_codon:yes gene_type:complete
MIPLYFIQLMLIVLGLSFLLSTLYVKYRDVFYIWSFVLLLGFFITPIVYPLEIIPFDYLKYYMLNPIARIIVDLRYVTLYHYIPDMKNYFITLIVSIVVFVFGLYFFRKRKNGFVEEI